DAASQAENFPGELVAAALEARESLLGLLAHAALPVLEVLRLHRLGVERRVAGARREGAVQLGGARGERLHEHEIRGVALALALRLKVALEVGERVAPS